MARTTAEVLDELFKAMDELVRGYPDGVIKTENRNQLLHTAFFPGGSGLWRGSGPTFAKLPPEFPIKPVMFVSHAFSAKVYRDGKGGKWHARFWSNLLRYYFDGLPFRPQECFFTNALMGLNPGENTDKMPYDIPFERECRDYFVRQVEIVDPRMIVALGDGAINRLRGVRLPRKRFVEVPLGRKMGGSLRGIDHLVPWNPVYSPAAYAVGGTRYFSDHRKLIAETYAEVG